MSLYRKKRARADWRYLTGILLLLYVCQVFPHDHAEAGHADHHSQHREARVPHTHHSHSNHHDTEDETGQPWPAHHHSLTQHVDPHFLRILSHELNVDPDVATQVACRLPTSEDESIRASGSDDDVWAPDFKPTFPLDSRAPPVRG